MVVCSEEGYVVYWGCRLLYNMCYRSEAGADVLLSRSTLLKVWSYFAMQRLTWTLPTLTSSV